MTVAAMELQVGSMLAYRELVVTPERVQWYGDGMHSAATGELRRAGQNIHTDVDYARDQGLTTAIADGMMSTAWISSMLLKTFGRDYLERGELRTKYIKPTEVGILLKVLGRVVEHEAQADGSVKFVLAVWTEDRAGVKLTDGDAVIYVRPKG
jgi:3-hydroxybutyryl-CoA dehydratase